MAEAYLWRGAFRSAEHLREYYALFESLYFYYPKQKASTALMDPPVSRAVEMVNFALSHDFYRFDFRSDLHKVSVPTLIFSGKQDWVTDSEQAKILQAGISNAQLILLDKCGHLPWVDQESLFLDAMKTFLSKNL